MIKIKTFLKNIDRFGSPIGFYIQDEQLTFKTIVGGILSVLVYIVAAMWFTYLSIMFLSNQMPANVISKKSYVKNMIYYQLEDPVVAFKLISPYQQDNNVVYFSSIASNYQNYNQIVRQQVIYQDGCQGIFKNIELGGFHCFYQPGFSLSLDLQRPGMEFYISIRINRCQAKYLSKGQRCANDSEFKDLVSQGVFQTIVFMQQFNENTGEVESSLRYFYQTMVQGIGMNLALGIESVSYDNSWLIQQYQEYNIISSVNQNTFNVNPKGHAETYNLDVEPYTIINIVLDPQIQTTQISTTKIATVLAEFSSLFGILSLLGIPIQYLSKQLGYMYVVCGIAQRYFPTETKSSICQVIRSNKKHHEWFSQENFTKMLKIENLLSKVVQLELVVALLLDSDMHKQVSLLGLQLDDFKDHPPTKTQINPINESYERYIQSDLQEMIQNPNQQKADEQTTVQKRRNLKFLTKVYKMIDKSSSPEDLTNTLDQPFQGKFYDSLLSPDRKTKA